MEYLRDIPEISPKYVNHSTALVCDASWKISPKFKFLMPPYGVVEDRRFLMVVLGFDIPKKRRLLD